MMKVDRFVCMLFSIKNPISDNSMDFPDQPGVFGWLNKKKKMNYMRGYILRYTTVNFHCMSTFNYILFSFLENFP